MKDEFQLVLFRVARGVPRRRTLPATTRVSLAGSRTWIPPIDAPVHFKACSGAAFLPTVTHFGG